MSWRAVVVLLASMWAARALPASEVHDLDFVMEHLPEVAMDGRYVTLPLDYSAAARRSKWAWQLQASFSEVGSGSLSLQDAGLAISTRHRLGSQWGLVGLGFLDDAGFHGEPERRPFAPLFSDPLPLDLPAEALFSGLTGSMSHYGAGLAATLQPPVHRYLVSFGALYSRVELRDVRSPFRLLAGADAGTTGIVDYSATYRYWVPFAAISWSLQRDAWLFVPRFSAGMPLPRRGWRGRIEGADFGVRGDTAQAGHGVHMGDAFAGFGLGIGYLPWHLQMDFGAPLSLALTEPIVHKGIDRAWLFSVSWHSE